MIIPGDGHDKDNIISLLQCLVELAPEPEHRAPKKDWCGTNKCPRCNYDGYRQELENKKKERP